MALPLSTRSAGVLVTATIWNELVTGINDIYNGVAAVQHVTLDGKTNAQAPGVSPSGDARIYYNTTDDELKLSLNAGAYAKFPGAVGLLQVSQDRSSVEESSTTTSWADTNLSISFTPQRDDSTIVLLALVTGIEHGGTSADIGLRLMRDATVLDTFINGGQCQASPSAPGFSLYSETSPGTSAVTYKVQLQRAAGASAAIINSESEWTSTLMVFEFAPA